MEEYISLKYILNLLDEHLEKSNGAEHYAYNILKKEVLAAPGVEAMRCRWVLTPHEEYANYRWNVTAECSNCNYSKGEIYAGFFTGFPQELARELVLDCARSVKLDDYCPNCGAKMDAKV